MGFPLHKPYPYSLCRWGFLHFRYLKCLVILSSFCLLNQPTNQPTNQPHQHPPALRLSPARSLYRASVTAAVAMQDETFSKALKAEAESWHLSNEKRFPGCPGLVGCLVFRLFFGDEILDS